MLDVIEDGYALASSHDASNCERVSYGYDAAGHVTSITYPSGRKLNITYAGGKPSAIGLAKDASSTATPLIDQIQFAPFGGLLSWNWQMTGGPQANSRVYDTSGRLVRYLKETFDLMRRALNGDYSACECQ